MQRKRARIMIVVISALMAVLLLVGLIVFPPSKGDILTNTTKCFI